MAKLPDKYRAIIVDQQRKLEALIRVQGLGPVRRVYQDILDAIEDKLANIAAGSFTELTTRGMLAQVKIGMATLVRESAGAMGEAAFRVGIASARTMIENLAKLEAALGEGVVSLPVIEIGRLRGLAAGQASSLLVTHQVSMARYGAHLVDKIQIELASALAVGETGHQAIDRVMKVGNLEWYRAERIVRTELSYAYNTTHREVANEQAAELDGDMWTMWSEHVDDDGTPLDDRVGDDSIAMHGQVAPPGGVFTQPPTTPRGKPISRHLIGKTWYSPPNRPNDRSVLMPWRWSWGVPGWIWDGRRVKVTETMAGRLSERWARRQAA